MNIITQLFIFLTFLFFYLFLINFCLINGLKKDKVKER